MIANTLTIGKLFIGIPWNKNDEECRMRIRTHNQFSKSCQQRHFSFLGSDAADSHLIFSINQAVKNFYANYDRVIKLKLSIYKTVLRLIVKKALRYVH